MTNPDSQDLNEDGAVSVVNDPAAGRYAARIGGELAGALDYVARDGVVVFTHIEVDPGFEGRGVGSTLTRVALGDVRDSGGNVDPQCPFVRRWIKEHPEYGDMVVP